MSFVNSFAFDRSSVRLFMFFRNRNGPNVEPWGTHALTSANEEVCRLSTTFCFLFLKKLHNKFKMLWDLPFCFSFMLMPSCHTLSTALKIVIHLIFYSIFFIQRTKRYDLYHLLLICHIDIFLDHIMPF